jgi:pyruvate formate lyase activating enzyme
LRPTISQPRNSNPRYPRAQASPDPRAQASPDPRARARRDPAPRLDATPATPALFAIAEGDHAVRCVACAHRCLIRPGRQGICHVRENRDGQLVTTVFGKAVSANADPIEKKPLFHFYPASIAFSIATRGCNFHCLHCQNWAISQAARDGLSVRSFDLPPERVVRAAIANLSRSIAYTYTEPTVFIEYVLATSRLAREQGLANVLVTNGYQSPEALEALAPVTDAANVDLKSFDDGFYRRILGARLAPVLDTLVRMKRRGIWLEVTTLLIPGLNDDPDELAKLAGWIVAELGPETPWHVSRFFPTYRLSDLDPTPEATIRRAVKIGRAAGLAHVYSGNMADGEEDTRCAGCGTTLIRRFGFIAERASLADGMCAKCGRVVAGVGMAEWGPREVRS